MTESDQRESLLRLAAFFQGLDVQVPISAERSAPVWKVAIKSLLSPYHLDYSLNFPRGEEPLLVRTRDHVTDEEDHYWARLARAAEKGNFSLELFDGRLDEIEGIEPLVSVGMWMDGAEVVAEVTGLVEDTYTPAEVNRIIVLGVVSLHNHLQQDL